MTKQHAIEILKNIKDSKINTSAEVWLEIIAIQKAIDALEEQIEEKSDGVLDDYSDNSGYAGIACNTKYAWVASNKGLCGTSINTGDYGNSINEGMFGVSVNTGDIGVSENTGDGGVSINTGRLGSAYAGSENSIAVAWGPNSKAKGAKGAFLVLTEWKYSATPKFSWELIDSVMVQVDGKNIKEDTWYQLVGKEVKEIGTEDNK